MWLFSKHTGKLKYNIIHFFSFFISHHKNISHTDSYSIAIIENFKNQRHGAVEARRAHNPDVLGSKPSGAIFFLLHLSFYKSALLLAHDEELVK